MEKIEVKRTEVNGYKSPKEVNCEVIFDLVQKEKQPGEMAGGIVLNFYGYVSARVDFFDGEVYFDDPFSEEEPLRTVEFVFPLTGGEK